MAMVHFCGDDNDLDDAELWAVIDSVAAYAAQKKQSRNPSTSPQNQKKNSSRFQCPSSSASSSQQLGHHVDEESNDDEVIQRPWLHCPPHALTIYENSNNEACRYHHNNNGNCNHHRNYNYNCASAVVKAKPLQQIGVASPPPKRQHLVQDLACRLGDSMDEKENNPAIILAALDGHNSLWNGGVPSTTVFM